MIPSTVSRWLTKNGHGEIVSSQPVGGGCINNGVRIKAGAGKSFFLKTNPHSPSDMFAREAEGLEALAREEGPRVPKPLLFGEDFLLLEDLNPAPRQEGYWPAFGRRLAALHDHKSPRYGFENDNYIGATKQPNSWVDDGHEFFAQRRLLYQAKLARGKGVLSTDGYARVERLAGKLSDLIPVQPASLIHGDLWTGNAMTDDTGAPAIIDPAAHYGWAEAELAMTALFGSFPADFYHAYQEVRPLEAGFRERFPLYNLYHLLNHLNLFGAGYLGQVMGILRRY